MKKRNNIIPVIFILLLSSLFLFSSCDKDKKFASKDYPLTVSFVDVGQGDGILIEYNDKVIVVDGGEETSTYLFNRYLKSRGIQKIDLYVATHPHSDHIGAIPGILSLYPTEVFMLPMFSELNMPATKLYENMLTAIDTAGCEVSFPIPGDICDIDDLHFEFFAPMEETENYNNMSLVFRMTYGNTSFLFAGDAETDSENLILESGADINADVLKVGHHGSSSSSGAAFINAVSPDIAVISCGKNNDYGHPDKETLKLFENYGTEVLRTDIDGTVVIYSDGKTIIKG